MISLVNTDFKQNITDKTFIYPVGSFQTKCSRNRPKCNPTI